MSKEADSSEAHWRFSSQDPPTWDVYTQKQAMAEGGCHIPRKREGLSNLSNGPQAPLTATTLSIRSLDLAPSWQVSLLAYCEY